MGRRRAVLVVCAGVDLAFGFAASANAQQSVADFYRGKQIQMVIGYSPGGTYDLYARLIARHLANHIPGHPAIIPVNMPGAGSRTAANWVYSIAPQDGTVLGTADQSLPLAEAMGDKRVMISIEKLQFVGNPSSDNNTVVTWWTSGVTTIEQAKEKEIPIGAIGSAGGGPSSQIPLAMNSFLGTKFKLVYGYPGGNDVNLAMESGEVEGFGSDTWSAWRISHPDWIRDKKINIVVQIGLEKASGLESVPLLTSLAKTPEDRAALELLSTPSVIGRPIFTAPGVPIDRVQALRQAFDETVHDPDFIADAQAAHISLNPVSGDKLQHLVDDLVAAPKAVAERLAQAVGMEASGN